MAKIFYIAALVLIIAGAGAIRVRLLSMPLERDEGEYAYVAQMMLKGIPPYLSAYSQKLPGTYAIYALIFTFFGQTCDAIHLGLLIVNAATIFVIFLLTKRLFGNLAAVIAAAAYAVMSLTTPVLGLSANAEHFLILPALIGILLLIGPVERRSLLIVFIAALLLGMGFIVKQHGIFFGIFAALYLFYSDLYFGPIRWKRLIVNQFIFAAGAIAPFAVTCFLFWRANAFDKFWFWTFTYAGEYGTQNSIRLAPAVFLRQFCPVINSAIPIWLFTLVGLFRVLFSISLRRQMPFVIGLLVFSFLSVCLGFYFRGHYFILLLPAVVILAGAGFCGFCDWASGSNPGQRRSIIIVLAGIGLVGCSLFDQRTYLFDGNPAKVCRRIYWPNPFSESLPIAEFIQNNSDVNDTIAVIGSEPQIYFYSARRAATPYIFTYPLMEIHPYAAEMQKEMIRQIETAGPKFLVFVNIPFSWLAQKGSIMTIVEWFDSYSSNYYDLVGLIDIYPKQSIYRWNKQVRNCIPVTDRSIAVYKRKQ